MNNEKTKTSDKASSNLKEPMPKGKVDEGDKAVKKSEDEVYQKEPAMAKAENPAITKENGEQPVHSIKK